jgi:ADP-heptose:LPS heptosyltransferase
MRILLLNQNHIGDALFTTPAIAALRAALPDATIVNAAVSGIEPVFAANPHLSERWDRPTARVSDYPLYALRIRRARFYAVVSFSASSTLFGVYARFSGAPVKIGFNHPATQRFMTHSVDLHDVEQHHAVDHLDQVALLADIRRDFPMEMPLMPAWREEADRALAGLALPGGRPIIALNPGATVDRKKWAPERWADLAGRLTLSGCQPVLFGGPGDADLTALIQSATSCPLPSLQGQLSLGCLAAAITRCAAFVSGDTGPMHVAVAVGTPVVALHGPTDPARTGPYTENAVVIHHPEAGPDPDIYGRMETVTVDEVFAGVHSVIS